MIIPDHLILDHVKITPLATPEQRKTPCGLSCGLDQYGYSARLGTQFKCIAAKSSDTLTMRTLKEIPYDVADSLITDKPCDFILRPYSFVLATTLERFELGSDVSGMIWIKSTLARAGLAISAAPVEPGFKGNLTIHVFNNTPYNFVLVPGEPFVQVQFLYGLARPSSLYDGKYQNSTGVVEARA